MKDIHVICKRPSQPGAFKIYLILACLWKKLEEKATGLKEIMSQMRPNICLQLMIRLMQPWVNPHSLGNELPIQSFALGQSGQA